MVGWLNWFNAEMSPKRYWWGRNPRMCGRLRGGGGGGGGGERERERERGYAYRYTVTTRMISALRMGSDESHFNVSLIVRGKVRKTLFINHNF